MRVPVISGAAVAVGVLALTGCGSPAPKTVQLSTVGIGGFTSPDLRDYVQCVHLGAEHLRCVIRRHSGPDNNGGIDYGPTLDSVAYNDVTFDFVCPAGTRTVRLDLCIATQIGRTPVTN